MNTKVQIFTTVCAVLLVAIALLTLRAVNALGERQDAQQRVGLVNGIETTWYSARGAHKVWSITPDAGHWQPWLDEHIAAFTAAQLALPPVKEK